MNGIEVVHEVPLGRVRSIEELLIQMGEGNTLMAVCSRRSLINHH